MTFLLDNNVLSYFFNSGHEDHLAACAKATPLAIAGPVEEELESYGKHGRRFQKWLPGSGVERRPIAVGSDADKLLEVLHPDPTVLKDRGEHGSIALAAFDPSLTFVANDRNAMWLAIHELHAPGERVVGVRVFLRRMRELAGLDLAAMDDVIAMVQGREPTWWRSWRGALP